MTLKLSRERGDEHQHARVLRNGPNHIHLNTGLYEEGIRQAKDHVVDNGCVPTLAWNSNA